MFKFFRGFTIIGRRGSVNIPPGIVLSPYIPVTSPQVVETGFDNIVVPMVRQMIGRTLGQDLVSVVPLTDPSGSLFYMDYSYNEKQFKLLKGYGF